MDGGVGVARMPQEASQGGGGDGRQVEATAEPTRPVRAWRSARGWLGSLGTVVAAIFLAELLRVPFTPVAAWLAPRFTEVRNALIIGVSVGGALFVASYVYLISQGVSLDATDFAGMLDRKRRRPHGGPGWGRAFPHLRGPAGSFDVEIRFAQIKAVLRLPGWRHDPLLLAVMAMIAGGLILVFGAFALIVLYGDPWLKVLVGGWGLYALVQIVRGFYKA